MTITEIESAVAAWLNAVRGARQLVKGRIGEAPAPAVPYLMYAVDLTQLPDSIPVDLGATAQTARAPDTRLEVVLSVVGDITSAAHSARNDAAALALSLRHSQRTTDVLAQCGLWGMSPIRNLTAVEVGTMRQRYDLTVTLSAILTADAPAESIHQVTAGVFELTIPTQVDITITEP